ncbi:DUF6318 family protein [Arthrobacter alpinus]|uniref:DUF6318 family protein n=1 Tax=Arthrobacter alpinus TaxID=656366 RepID=UPI0012F83609|nr:DUF6318 family protein [Arthrobacter alpinus]
MPATADAPAQNVPTPVLPEKAREFSKEGLEAFARHWYSTLGYAYETGDLAPMTAITDPGCKTCAGAKTSITTIYGDGGWIVGAKVTIDSSTSNFAVVPDGTYQAIVWVQQEAGTTYLADGSSLAPKPASISRPDIVVAAFQQGQWKTMKAEHLTKE